MAISNAVGQDRISRVVGYELGAGVDGISTPFLPQRVAIFAEVNTDKISGVTVDKGREITSADEAGQLYGYGSPIHQVMRILRPLSGGGLGGIPTIVYPQATAVGATAATATITPSGTATASGTHFIKINGRNNLDGQFYAINIVKGDTAAGVAAKIETAINAVIGAPVSADEDTGVTTVTTKWKGATAASLIVEIDTNNTSLGITYAIGAITGGTGVVSLTNALLEFASVWNTLIINTYGAAQFDALEAFVGVPGIGTSTGRYAALEFKPCIALWGSAEDAKADLIAITDAAARKTQVTNVLCPAPNSKGFPWEAAANGCAVLAPILQNTPNIDVNGRSYPDIPVPVDGNIGDMAYYDNRDYLVKRGCSTVSFSNGRYVLEDLVTTYHPTGEVTPAYRYVRNLNIHWNFAYAYKINELLYVVDKTIVSNDEIVTADNVVKPKQWKALIIDIVDVFISNALITDREFTKASLQVGISSLNPDRFETSLKYKITGVARISSTTVQAFFNFGTI